ncbi:MFS family permease [Bradyrhizobium sp. LM3.2]
MTKDERFVILASSLGTVFEWYDFYLYGSLAGIIGAQFFSAYPPATRDIFALLAFAAGFLVRPFGAIVFGRIGDIVGRKYTFLVTILIMGLSTFIVGLLPNAATIGIAAPIILIALRASPRAWRSAVNMAVRRPTSRSMLRTASAATTRPSSRPRRRSACSCRCW